MRKTKGLLIISGLVGISMFILFHVSPSWAAAGGIDLSGNFTTFDYTMLGHECKDYKRSSSPTRYSVKCRTTRGMFRHIWVKEVDVSGANKIRLKADLALNDHARLFRECRGKGVKYDNYVALVVLSSDPRPKLRAECNRVSTQKDWPKCVILFHKPEVLGYCGVPRCRTSKECDFEVDVSGLKRIYLAFQVMDAWDYADVEGTLSNLRIDTRGDTDQAAAEHKPYAGKVLDLDGTNDYVRVQDSPSLNPINQITIEAWYRPTKSFQGTGSDPIINKGYYFHEPPYYQYHLGVCGDMYSYNQRALLADIAINDKGIHASKKYWRLNTWTHIAVTYNGHQQKFYLDGNLVTVKEAKGPIGRYEKDLFIGKFTNLNKYLPGQIAEVRIWKRALSKKEIQSNMKRQFSGSENGLVLYYNFKERTPSGKIKDLSPYGNHGTVYGGAKIVSLGVKPNLLLNSFYKNYDISALLTSEGEMAKRSAYYAGLSSFYKNQADYIDLPVASLGKFTLVLKSMKDMVKSVASVDLLGFVIALRDFSDELSMKVPNAGPVENNLIYAYSIASLVGDIAEKGEVVKEGTMSLVNKFPNNKVAQAISKRQTAFEKRLIPDEGAKNQLFWIGIADFVIDQTVMSSVKAEFDYSMIDYSQKIQLSILARELSNLYRKAESHLLTEKEAIGLMIMERDFWILVIAKNKNHITHEKTKGLFQKIWEAPVEFLLSAKNYEDSMSASEDIIKFAEGRLNSVKKEIDEVFAGEKPFRIEDFIPTGFQLKDYIDLDSDRDGVSEKIVHCERKTEALFFVLDKKESGWKKYRLGVFDKEDCDYFLIKDLYDNPLGSPGDGYLSEETTVLIMGMRLSSTSVFPIPFKWTGRDYESCPALW